MIRVLIAANLEERQRLCAGLAAGAEIEPAGQARDEREAVRLAHALRPDIVLLSAGLPPLGGYAAAEKLAVSGLPLETILVTPDASNADLLGANLRAAMRAGAKDSVSSEASPAELCDCVRSVYAEARRRRSAAFAADAAPSAGAKVIAVSGAKGGIGKTTLAVNLAAALAAETQAPTVLLDLYTQFGDAALMLNLFPRRTLADLVKNDIADIDFPLLEEHLERHECGLRMLAGASAPLPLDALSPECLDQMLSLLRRENCQVVLDVPPVLHDTTRLAVSQADAVLLVANLFDLTTLADTRLWLDALSGSCVAPDAIQVVLNRASPANRLQLPDITRTLGRAAHCLIPNDGKLVPASVNAGLPFTLSHPNSKVACSVFGLARSFHAASR